MIASKGLRVWVIVTAGKREMTVAAEVTVMAGKRKVVVATEVTVMAGRREVTVASEVTVTVRGLLPMLMRLKVVVTTRDEVVVAVQRESVVVDTG